MPYVVGVMIVVITLVSRLSHNGVACRKVENNNVIQFYFTQALHPTVVPMWPRDIALSIDNRQGVLGQRHCQRSLRDTRTIANLRNKEVIARKE